MFKKYMSFVLILAFILSVVIPVSAENMDYTDVINDMDDLREIINTNEEPDEQIFSTATLDDDFADDAVLVVLTREASRDNRIFTALDFQDVGCYTC